MMHCSAETFRAETAQKTGQVVKDRSGINHVSRKIGFSGF
jgi:hypothetical protein